MASNFKEYFSYSKSERNGLLILLVLVIVVFIAPSILNYFSNEREFDYSEFEKKINQFEAPSISNDKLSESNKIQYFSFDPNTINLSDMRRLGLSKKQSQTIVNYRNAGGVFKAKTDFSKIYTINSELYLKLKPYILIVAKSKHESDSVTKKRTQQARSKWVKNESIAVTHEISIELNTADSIDLIKLYGIGPSLSRRIIRYRNFLGGYCNREQLLEVYGLNQETYNKIANAITTDTSLIQKINLNQIEFKALNKHPYFSYAHTKSVFKYRKLMNGFRSVNEIVANNLVDSATYAKVKPYLRVN
ncbi:MAG: helix-hairpin-helix domain-containing protein [Salinivirgaceae bacterium]|nr:helix-hairpin-helix domain-containing protein [Salinivirgaceae bacterium]